MSTSTVQVKDDGVPTLLTDHLINSLEQLLSPQPKLRSRQYSSWPAASHYLYFYYANHIAMPPKGSAKRKAAAASAASTPADASAPQTPTLAESLSYLTYPRPFKNPAYTKNAARRTRTLKSVLSQERERERIERERRRAEREAALATTSAEKDGAGGEASTEDRNEEKMDLDKPEIEMARSKLSALEEEEDIPTYTSIEAPPSILPQKHYCDITGLEAPYTDPATGLRYHDKSIYEFIKTLNTSAVKEYLALRGVNPIVK